MPGIFGLRRQDPNWSNHFDSDEDALSVKDAGENRYDFYINMDNVYLKAEIKQNDKTNPALLETRYKSGMFLLGIALLNYYENNKDFARDLENNETSIYDQMKIVSRAISPILLPMISGLGELEFDL